MGGAEAATGAREEHHPESIDIDQPAFSQSVGGEKRLQTPASDRRSQRDEDDPVGFSAAPEHQSEHHHGAASSSASRERGPNEAHGTLEKGVRRSAYQRFRGESGSHDEQCLLAESQPEYMPSVSGSQRGEVGQQIGADRGDGFRRADPEQTDRSSGSYNTQPSQELQHFRQSLDPQQEPNGQPANATRRPEREDGLAAGATATNAESA